MTRTVLPLLVLVLAGCDRDAPLACTDELGVAVRPDTTTVSVGGLVTPAADLWTCGGRIRPTPELTLHVVDASVMVLTADGRSAVAIAPGVTDVRVDDAQLGTIGRVRVTVIAAP